jgi:hypothetical protein
MIRIQIVYAMQLNAIQMARLTEYGLGDWRWRVCWKTVRSRVTGVEETDLL